MNNRKKQKKTITFTSVYNRTTFQDNLP